MKLALFGHGTMNQLVAARARDEEHEVALVVTSSTPSASSPTTQGRIDNLTILLHGVDVAVDFSVADAVLTNITACAQAGIPLVEGTTGWYGQIDEARKIVEEHGAALVYGANFSIGVNLFYCIVERAAELFQGLDSYAAFIEEAHHARKRDAPSGTALRLRDVLATHLAHDIPVASTRAGFIPGTHRVGFDSAADQITLTHTARTREGFAAGALLAAKWIVGRRGVYEFSEALDGILRERMKEQ